MDVENAHDEVIVIEENQNNEASSAKVDVIDETDKCDETSEVTSKEIPKGESEEVPQEFDSTADVKQVTETPEQQQRSDAPEPAVQVVSDQDDAAQSVQLATCQPKQSQMSTTGQRTTR